MRINGELDIKLLRIVGQSLVVVREQVDVRVKHIDPTFIHPPPVAGVQTLEQSMLLIILY